MNSNLKTQLESYSRNNFGASLFELVKYKVEVEALTYNEIAHMLEVTPKEIGTLINYFGIDKSQAFPARFEKRYGKGAVHIFKTIIEHPNKHLSDVGRHFGFSREYARQVYKLIYGIPYTQAFKKKVKRINVPKTPARSPRMQCVCEVRDKIRSFGISAHVVKERNINRINAGGSKIDIRIVSTYRKAGRKKYFRIVYNRNLKLDCDFVICICKDSSSLTHYIIPRDHMPGGGICLIPQANLFESKYTKFRENWKLLLKKGRENHQKLHTALT